MMDPSMRRSPWEEDDRRLEENDLFRDSGGNELLGQILERSTSAPPLPSETKNFDFGGPSIRDEFRGTTESYLFGNGRRTPPTSRLGLYEAQSSSGGRGTAPMPSAESGGFIPQYNVDRTGRSTAPGLYSDGTEALFGTRTRASLIDDDDEDALGGDEAFLFQERGMHRSRSAAPLLLRESKSVGPPPGYGMGDSGGMQRSASTGVIGGQQRQQRGQSSVLRSLGLDQDGTDLGAVRPAPKTLMDLIQEDFPSSPSPVYKQEENEDYYARSEHSSHSRPRSSSPPQYDRMDSGRYGLGQQERARRIEEERYRMEEQERMAYRRRQQQQQDAMGNITHSMDRMFVSQRDEYSRDQQGFQYVLPPQRSDQMYREYAQETRAPRSHYAPVQEPDMRGRVPQPGPYYQQAQPIYYEERQSRNVAMNVAPTQVQTQILPPGQPVYVNAASSYGYSTAQYAPGSAPQQHRVVHLAPQQMQGGPPHEQYISVVPVQGGGTGRVAQVSSQGGYAYWQQQDGPRPPSAQPLSPDAYGGGTPTSLSRAAVDSPPGSGRRQRGVRSPTERERTTRRGGRGRRGGVDGTKHSPGGSSSSPLLEEFRASKSRDWSIIDIKGHVVEFCQDQNGSRFIQQRLEIGDLKEKQIVMNEALPDIRHLRNDVFGNYVVQKLLEFGTPEMRADIRDTLTGEMLALSLQMYGCRVVQKALEMLHEDDLPRLLREFHHNVLSCIQDQNGNHVIQKCVEVMSIYAKEALAAGDTAKAQFSSEQIDFIIDDVLANVASLSCHPYGCRVLQRILEHCVETKKNRTLDEIQKCHRQLLDDQYGNYVIQHVLQYGRHSDRESILQIVVDGGLLPLSKQKFASNVVEKLLKYGSPGQRNAIVREMLKKVDEHTGAPMENGGTSVALLMVRDAYANYVVQTALDVVPEGEEKQMLLEELTTHSAQLRNYTFAKHIVTKLGA